MGFFGIGTGEILLILVLALIIWGPGKLPEIARTLGKTVRALKKASFDLTTAVTREIDGTEKDPLPPELRGKRSDRTEESSSDVAKARAQRRDDQSKNLKGYQQ